MLLIIGAKNKYGTIDISDEEHDSCVCTQFVVDGKAKLTR